MKSLFQYLIKWTNDNGGFLTLIIFIATILFGWLSGIFNSLIKRPRLKARFIAKATFYCSWPTGRKYKPDKLNETFDLHKTAFSIYLNVANVGSKITTIDKVYLGYYKSTTKRKLFSKQIVWLTQWHSLDHFKFMYNNKIIVLPPFRGKNEIFKENDETIEVGKNIIGVAYFEQEEAWGNYMPKPIDQDNSINVIIKIKDIYSKSYKFKTVVTFKSLEDAQKINPTFGIIGDIKE